MVTQNFAEYPPHYVTHGPGKFEVDTSISYGDAFKRENTFFDLDHGIKVTLNIAQQLLYHVSYSPAKFVIAMSYVLVRKYII